MARRLLNEGRLRVLGHSRLMNPDGNVRFDQLSHSCLPARRSWAWRLRHPLMFVLRRVIWRQAASSDLTSQDAHVHQPGINMNGQQEDDIAVYDKQ
jgi:hypothetical protein